MRELELGERGATSVLAGDESPQDSLGGDEVPGLTTDWGAVQPRRHLVAEPIEHTPGHVGEARCEEVGGERLLERRVDAACLLLRELQADL